MDVEGIISIIVCVSSLAGSVLSSFSARSEMRHCFCEIIRMQLISIAGEQDISYFTLERAESLYKMYEHFGGNGLGKAAIETIRKKYLGGGKGENDSDEPAQG